MKKFKEFLNINEASRIHDKTVSPFHVSTDLRKKDKDGNPINPHELTGDRSVSIGNRIISGNEALSLQKHLTRTENPYPNINPNMRAITDPHEFVSELGQHMKRNLQWANHRAQNNVEGYKRSLEWYHSAHAFAHKLSKRFEIPHHMVTAVIATQSPQREWNQNASLAERICKIHKYHQATAWSPEMDKISSKVFKSDNAKHQSMLSAIRGKSLGDLTDSIHKAGWIRAYDEAHHARHHREVGPEGHFGLHMMNADGKKRTDTSWGTFNTIEKAVKVLESGGNMEIISRSLGNRFKVRSFNNNMLQPNSPRRDVTNDTHAAAVLAGRTGDKRWATQLMGNAALYRTSVQATNSVADETGVTGAALQAAVWKQQQNISNLPDHVHREVEMNWDRFRLGEIGQEEVHANIDDLYAKHPFSPLHDLRTDPNIVSTFESVKHRQTFKDFL